MKNPKIQYGRFQLQPSAELDGTYILYLENIHFDDDFWVTISQEYNVPPCPAGFLKFRKIGPVHFVLDDIRPGRCPIKIDKSAKYGIKVQIDGKGIGRVLCNHVSEAQDK